MVFAEQAVFGEAVTYYGFFGANLVAATFTMVNAATNPDMSGTSGRYSSASAPSIWCWR